MDKKESHKNVLGNTIRYFRDQRGYSQEQLAEFSKLNSTYIRDLERDLSSPTAYTLGRNSSGLGLNILS
ncbi:helix-turn-helix domain-containing protein [Bacillus shivajii]|uniref:helix-turn-helix domain-containing protein n=1 Tax=Bacillus shivajii TaxID=1983719 RepID=UPI001CF9FAE9|nr:helix-turn-helix transcriptional regulator [Bacillus shivajii]UCZ52937.1 helix-turn-helix domain-containing protein [Bacillus shivajii]